MTIGTIYSAGFPSSPPVHRCAKLIVAAVMAAATQPAHADCKIAKIEELPVEVINNRPFTSVAINGEKVRALIDTGAQVSVIWRSEAVRLQLPLSANPNGKLYGVGGESAVQKTVIKKFSLGETTVNDLPFLVSGAGDGTVILGEDIWGRFTVEFDFGHGKMILYRAKDCGNAPLAYWSTTASQVTLEGTPESSRKLAAQVMINGYTMLASLDSGAWRSTLTNAAAAKAGITPNSEGVAAAGTASGIGGESRQIWIGNFKSFAIGDEEIKNAKIYIADLFRGDTYESIGTRIPSNVFAVNMLLGADFFLSHRLIVAADSRTLAFTYNGGPVFRVAPQQPQPEPEP